MNAKDILLEDLRQRANDSMQIARQNQHYMEFLKHFTDEDIRMLVEILRRAGAIVR